jgi:hypothetical protein
MRSTTWKPSSSSALTAEKATGVDQLVPSPDTNTAANGEFHCHPANTINALTA